MSEPDPQQEPFSEATDIVKTFLQVAGEKLPAPMLLAVLILFLVIVWGVAVDGNLFYLLLLLPILGVGGWVWREWQQGKEKQEERRHERDLIRDAHRFELERERLRRNQSQAPAEMSEPAEPVEETTAALERRYLERLASGCELLPMEAVDKTATRPDAARVALNKVFTQVDVIRPPAEDGKQVAAARQQEPKVSREPAIAVIGNRKNKYLVLLGQPGSGKSTLVDYIALCLAGQVLGRPGDTTLDELEEQKWASRWLLPVRVILREYAEQGLRHNLSLWQFITDELAKPDAAGRTLSAYAPHLRRQLHQQGGLLLLDGLDEVPDAHKWRERLRQEIRDFAAEFDQVRILVTSRPYAYDKPEWQLPDFARAELLDFNEEQMFSYVDRRYELMAGGEAGLDQAQAEAYAHELKEQIEERKALRELAARPLLLALITSLHHWRGGRSLPQDREKLYDESVDLLIDLWQQRKRLPEVDPNDASAHELTHLLSVGPVELRDALSKVAFEVHRDQPKPEGTADVPAARLAGALHEVMDPQSKVTTRQIIQYVQNRAGLLEERDGTVPGKEVYAFAHRTFQEYMAGCYLLTQDNFADEAAKLGRSDPGRWREALLLAARRDKNPTPAWDLVDALCQPAVAPQPGDAVAGEDWWGAFLAGQILLERELWHNPPERRRQWVMRVKEWLAALLSAGALPPRDRALAGQMLTQLGDPRRGVGVDPTSGLPDILWSMEEIPAGAYTLVDDKKRYPVWIEGPYRLARYPITNAQFQCFVDARDWDEAAWWQDIPEYQRKIDDALFPDANHPRVNVSWYQAMAFCRWLTTKLHAGDLPAEPLTGDLKQYTITLPHEHEWEVAARWPNSDAEQRIYPWGPEWDAQKANTSEGGIGQTTAVGIYPSGRNEALDLYDLSGNVAEWCRNKHGDPDDDQVDGSNDSRGVRGGSFDLNSPGARAGYRNLGDPDVRASTLGFRVVVRRPPSHLDL
jgi:formylglycine-generating enzyme required for sulfatase activity/energy-coupling factor transporter ATP-binding protein EcfA2